MAEMVETVSAQKGIICFLLTDDGGEMMKWITLFKV